MKDLDAITEEIIGACRERRFLMQSIIRIEQSMRAYLRTSLGFGRAETEKQKKKILEQVKEIMAYAKSDRKSKPPEDFEQFDQYLTIVFGSIAPLEDLKRDIEKRLEDLAKELPIYEWWKANVFKTSTLGLAVLIGETGNLSHYPNDGRQKRRGPSCLYKRMGVAVIDGRRQGSPSSNDTDEWIRHGYSPRRRAIMSFLGSALVRSKGQYYDIYLKRKQYETHRFERQGKVIVIAGKYPKGIPKTECVPLAHIDNRARRYTEKKLLKDMWKEWNQYS